MKLTIQYLATAELPLQYAEVKHLMDLSTFHYDGVCRRAGLTGGFLRGMLAAFTEPKLFSQIVFTLSFGEMDTLCKILEQPEANPALVRKFRFVLDALLAAQLDAPSFTREYEE